MASVVDLERWRRDRARAGAAGVEGERRLERAVERLERALSEAGWDRRAPQWVVTELLAIQGALSMGMGDEAAVRAESLAMRSERRRARQ